MDAFLARSHHLHHLDLYFLFLERYRLFMYNAQILSYLSPYVNFFILFIDASPTMTS